VYTTAGSGVARDALVYFERVHAFFADYMHMMPAKAARPARLIIFSGATEFKLYRPSETAYAFYMAGFDRDYIVMTAFDTDSYPIVVHEYVHLAVQHSGAAYPIWLNEGLAEYFSTLEPMPGKMSVGKVPVQRLGHLNNDGPFMPLSGLLAVGFESEEYTHLDHVDTFYSESWALVHMLMTDKRYQPKTDGYLQAVARGADAKDALTSTYGRTVAQIEEDLRQYIYRKAFNYAQVTFQEPKIGEKLSVRAVDDFEAGVMTANLLSSGAPDAAAKAFDALARQKPDDLSLVESRAYFELRRGDQAAARPLFARAVELGSTNAQLYIDDASLTVGDAVRTGELLARALSLLPDDATTRIHVAAVQLQEGRAVWALATLQPVTSVSAEDAFTYFGLLGNVYLQQREWDGARAAAASAVRHARTANEKTQAADLAKRVDTTVAAEPPMMETGRITNVECGGDARVMEVTSAKGILRLLIDKADAIRVVGTRDGQADIPCGPQSTGVRVGYVPADDPVHKTIGNVRLLDFGVK
jgi:tetratricopeptide (TPR) repeat protein